MPAIANGKVLVTGANGFIAAWIVKSLLQAGFSVKGTVRSQGKTGYLRDTFKSFGDKLELVIVKDITKEASFAECVSDVDAIVHTASPFHYNAGDPADVITPAVEGTLSVLKAAAEHGPSVKRVVVLSSIVAAMRTVPPGTSIDESSWNEDDVATVNSKGREASPGAVYQASKTLAERAAWVWWNERKGSLPWDLVTLLPPYVYGPALHGIATPQELGTSAKMWWDAVVGGKMTDESLAKEITPWVDVRDIAEAHTLALQKDKAGGNRFIISKGLNKWQDFVSVAHRASSKISAGNTSYSKTPLPTLFDSTKSVEVLEMKYRTEENTTVDTIRAYEEMAWL